MNCRKTLLLLAAAFAVLAPLRSPAPLIYTPGEGWYYELPGKTLNWQRPRAKEQLEVAEQAVQGERLFRCLAGGVSRGDCSGRCRITRRTRNI